MSTLGNIKLEFSNILSNITYDFSTSCARTSLLLGAVLNTVIAGSSLSGHMGVREKTLKIVISGKDCTFAARLFIHRFTSVLSVGISSAC